jgi:hypothetical protein
MKLDSLQEVIRTLNEAQVAYLLVGGLAVNAWNFVRPTKDIDLVIGLGALNLGRALSARAAIGYGPPQPITAAEMADPERRRHWRESKGMVVLKMWSDHHRDTPVDVFIEEPFEFNKEYARAKPHEIAEGIEAPVVALGTLLRMKEAAGRPQDLEDIRALTDLYGL